MAARSGAPALRRSTSSWQRINSPRTWSEASPFSSSQSARMRRSPSCSGCDLASPSRARTAGRETRGDIDLPPGSVIFPAGVGQAELLERQSLLAVAGVGEELLDQLAEEEGIQVVKVVLSLAVEL